jgi:hypothetical protein
MFALERDASRRSGAEAETALQRLAAVEALVAEQRLGFIVEPRLIRGADRFHGTYPPNFNEGTHLISRKGPTRFQVVPFVF